MQSNYSPGPRPKDPKTGRFVKKQVRLCRICGDFAAPIRCGNSKLLCKKHLSEWWANGWVKIREVRRKTKRVLWAFNLPGGEYTTCPYIHPSWPQHKQLRIWKASRMRMAKKIRTYYKKRAFAWAEKGLIDITPQELYNLISSSSTQGPRK